MLDLNPTSSSFSARIDRRLYKFSLVDSNGADLVLGYIIGGPTMDHRRHSPMMDNAPCKS